MIPELPPNPRAELEARITAWLLGELSADEAAQVRAQIEQDRELQKLRDRLSQTLNLLRETVATPAGETPAQPAPLKLSPDRREKLLASFKTVTPKEFAKPARRKISLIEALAIAACFAILAALLLPSLSKSKSLSSQVAILSNLRQLDLAKHMWAEDNGKPASATPTMRDLQPYLGRGRAGELPKVADETYNLGAVSQAPVAQLKDKLITMRGDNRYPTATSSTAPTAGLPSVSDVAGAAAPTPAAPVLTPIPGMGEPEKPVSVTIPAGGTVAPPSDIVAQNGIVLPQEKSESFATAETSKEAKVVAGGNPVENEPTLSPPPASMPSPAPAPTAEAKGATIEVTSTPSAVGGANYYANKDQEKMLARKEAQESRPQVAAAQVDVVTADASAPNYDANNVQLDRGTGQAYVTSDGRRLGYGNANPASATTFANASTANAPAAAATRFRAMGSTGGLNWTSTNGVVAYQAAQTKSAPAGGYGFLTQNIEGSTKLDDAPMERQPLPALVPQPEVQTSDNAFTTFSLNISDAAFNLAAASLEKGQMPQAGSMRCEEFINAFNYRDPEPAPGAPIAFAWERASDPFAHNRDLLRFSIKTAAQGRQPGRPLNLVLLLDKSGSMERADRVEIIANALRVLASQLQPNDILSVVVFARTPRLFIDGAPGRDAGKIAKELRDLTPEGGTNLEEAMKLAYATALRHYLAEGENRVVLLTDGAANLGDVEPDVLKKKVEDNRRQGVALDCFGVGWDGYNDELLEKISRAGGGRYAFLNTPEEAATEFAGKLAGALRVAAADVKVQVEFNPARVTAYRQIGYAKDQLKKEDFRNNNAHAASLGAAETGAALYTIAVKSSGEGPLCTVRVRYHVPGTSDTEEHAWTVPYTGKAIALRKASPAMRLAATAAAFSEWLGGSPYAGEVTPGQLLTYLRGVPEVYGPDARPKKLEWMIRQAKSISGR